MASNYQTIVSSIEIANNIPDVPKSKKSQRQICDECKTRIFENRYSSLVKDDYDLCE